MYIRVIPKRIFSYLSPTYCRQLPTFRRRGRECENSTHLTVWRLSPSLSIQKESKDPTRDFIGLLASASFATWRRKREVFRTSSLIYGTQKARYAKGQVDVASGGDHRSSPLKSRTYRFALRTPADVLSSIFP